MRTRHVSFLLAAVLLAGCIPGDDGPLGDRLDRSIEVVDRGSRDAERGSGEYWMVWIRGNETDTRSPRVACARVPPSFGIVHHNRSVWYRPPATDIDPDEAEVLVAFDHEDRSSGCPEVERLVADPSDGYTVEMGTWGELSITVHPDGTLDAAGRSVPVGRALVASYEGYPTEMGRPQVEGGFVAEVLGAWDRDDIWERGRG